MTNRFTLLVVAVTLVAIALRIPYLAEYRDVANLDEANIGVMAIDILRGHFPFFMYGHTYFGPLEALFIALFLGLGFPHDALTLRLAMTLIVLLAGFVLWRGARKLLEDEGAIITYAWFALPPVILVVWTILPNGGHLAGLLTSALIFYLAARIIVTERPSDLLYFIFGLVIGFSLWNHPGNLLTVVAAVVIIIAANWRVIKSWAIPIALAGCGMGGAPFWLSIYRTLDTLQFGQKSGVGRTPDAILADIIHSLKAAPLFLGYDLAHPVVGMVATGLLLFTLALSAPLMVISLWFRRPEGWAPLFGWILVGESLVAYSLMDAGKFGWMQYRYFLPTLLGLALIIGFTSRQLAHFGKKLAYTIPFLLIVINSGIAAYAYQTGGYDVYRMDTRLDDRFFTYKRLMPLLRRNAVTRAYVRFYDDTSIVYESGATIIVAAYSNSRMKEYSAQVDAAASPAFALFADAIPLFEKSLTASGATYKVDREGDYTLYHQIIPPPFWYKPLPVGAMQITAFPHPETAQRAVDGNFDTFWNSQKIQTGDEWLLIDLGAPQKIARVDILPSGESDMPSQIAIDLSRDGVNWKTVADVPNIGAFFWAGSHPIFKADDGFNQYIFAGQNSRYVRIRQTAGANRHWHVREVFLYSAEPMGAPTQTIDREVAADELQRAGIGRLIGDFSISAIIDIGSKGAIWVNRRANRNNKDPNHNRQNFAWGEFDGVAVHRRDLAQVGEFLNNQRMSYETLPLGDHLVFYKLARKEAPLTTVTEKECHEKSDTLLCDLGKSEEIVRLRLAGGLAGRSVTRACAAETPDNPETCAAKSVALTPFYQGVHWSGSHLVGSAPTGEWGMTPVTGRYLTVRLR